MAHPDTQHPTSPPPNPYQHAGFWFWYDETGEPHGPFKTQTGALKQLTKYAIFLEQGPTLWQNIRYEWVPTFFKLLTRLVKA